MALEHDALGVPARRSVERLLAAPVLQRYLALAAGGRLRQRAVADPARTAAASVQVRIDCLQMLRAAAGLAPADLGVPEVTLRPVPRAEELLTLRRRLGDDVGRPLGGLGPGRARFAAAVSMVLDTAAHAGELDALTGDDLIEDRRGVRVVRQPQHGFDAASPSSSRWSCPRSPGPVWGTGCRSGPGWWRTCRERRARCGWPPPRPALAQLPSPKLEQLRRDAEDDRVTA